MTFEFEAGEIADHDQIVWGEDVLVQSGKFSLPGKKALLDNRELEAVLIDVTEHPIEAQKNSGNGIPAKRNAIPSKAN